MITARSIRSTSALRRIRLNEARSLGKVCSRRGNARREESGFFTIWVLGLCAMVFFLGGLSFDMWHAFNDRRELSALVDGAAIAGTSGIDLAAFKTDGTVVINEDDARARVIDYLTKAQADSDVAFTLDKVEVKNNTVVVTASSKLHLSFASILAPDQGDVDITMSGVSEPRAAQ